MILVDGGQNSKDILGACDVKQLSDVELVERGVSAIYERYAPYVAKIGYQVMGSHHDLEDIVQDVFVEVHRDLRTLREPNALRGWLATITVRHVRRQLRKKRLVLLLPWSRDQEPHPLDATPSGSLSPEDWALLQNILEVLEKRATVDELIAWRLRFISGHTNVEIAQTCECSERTIYRRIARAEQLIEKELRP